MRCNKARRYLSQAMDEQLPSAVTRDLGDHLDGCRECRDFQADLMMGRRLLSATTPELSEGFDWRLQLKLNQAVQQAAGEAIYPWQEENTQRRSWLGPFTTAAACGLAAVLALAIFLGPTRQDMARPGSLSSSGYLASGNGFRGVSDRLPLIRDRRTGPFANIGGVQRSVSRTGGLDGKSEGLFSLDQGWSGNRLDDLMTIQDLQLRNQRLSNQIFQYQRQLAILREQLDSPDSNAIDLGGH